MITAFFRTVLLYGLLIVGLRLTGKRQIGQLEPIEFVLMMLLSDLASVPMQDFGLQFHQKLLEDGHDPWAERFQNELPAFRRACLTLGGKPLPVGDAAYAFEIFDGLGIAVQLWLGDDEFPPNLRFLWDENACQYIRYETMYFAKALLLNRIAGKMEES